MSDPARRHTTLFAEEYAGMFPMHPLCRDEALEENDGRI